MVSWKEEQFAGTFAAETSALESADVCVSRRLYDGFKCQNMAVEIQYNNADKKN